MPPQPIAIQHAAAQPVRPPPIEAEHHTPTSVLAFKIDDFVLVRPPFDAEEAFWLGRVSGLSASIVEIDYWINRGDGVWMKDPNGTSGEIAPLAAFETGKLLTAEFRIKVFVLTRLKAQLEREATKRVHT